MAFLPSCLYGYRLPLEALQKLRAGQAGEHRDVIDYIKNYSSLQYGMEEADVYLRAMHKKMLRVLDPHETQTGCSFNFTVQIVKAVLLGIYTYEEIAQAKKDEDERFAKYLCMINK
jgi:hypothetical protein